MGATRSTSLVIIPSTSGGSTVVGVIRSRAGGGSALFAQAPSVPAPATPRPASPAQRRASRRLGAGDVRVESRGQRCTTCHVNLYVLVVEGWKPSRLERNCSKVKHLIPQAPLCKTCC